MERDDHLSPGHLFSSEQKYDRWKQKQNKQESNVPLETSIDSYQRRSTVSILIRDSHFSSEPVSNHK